MKPLPVQLDHEALPAPHSIHEESLDDHVRLGLREAGLVDELQEGHLEIAPGDASERRRAWAAVTGWSGWRGRGVGAGAGGGGGGGWAGCGGSRGRRGWGG